MSKKITTEEFIDKAKLVHGDKYDYSLVEYVGNKTKVKIKCIAHNFVFEQRSTHHLNGGGCSKCAKQYKPTAEEFIQQAKEIHSDRYDYSLVEYVNANTKVEIKCPTHNFVFEQKPSLHLHGCGCPRCGGSYKSTTDEFIEKAKSVHGDKYDYSSVEYVNSCTKIKIICPAHGIFEQIPSVHLTGCGCPKCIGFNKTTEEFILDAKSVHGNIYDYSSVEYLSSKTKIKIICKIHGVFEQTPSKHLTGSGCTVCNHGFTTYYKLQLINDLQHSDLLHMDPIELLTIIGQGKLPNSFSPLVNTDADSDGRITTLKELRARIEQDGDNVSDLTDNTSIDDKNEEFIEVDEVDAEITSDTPKNEPRLPSVNIINDLHSLDNSLYATMDEEAFESLIQYKLRKIWNNVLNNEVSIESIQNETGGRYFNIIKTMFFEEYNQVDRYEAPSGYSFKHTEGLLKGQIALPNLMQKLTVHRLLKNKSYGNWSGTGAGKTISFIIASRELDARLTLIVTLNSTIEQTCETIKTVYPDSKCFTDYRNDYVFDRNKHNYLVLNYEKFQQEYSEEMFQSLTNNNIIDFVVIDEVHNAKQRKDGEENESIRRQTLTRLLCRIKENSFDLHTLVMSATPVINELFEAKSLLTLMTRLEFDDLNTRRTLPNALKIFQQLILNGLRFLPKYEININELTGHNMSNLNIDGSHLLEQLLALQQRDYVGAEKLLLDDKLKASAPYLKKGTIIYTYITTDIVNRIEDFVKAQGFTVGTYTGEESTFIRDENKRKFINGEIDILIGSRPIGTGVDGLQKVCDRMILITLPWTDSEYTQLKGRIYRQGSIFGSVEHIIPQIRIELEEDDFWSWDIQRLNLIRNKRTLADAAVDGVIPSRILPTPETMFKKSQEALGRWQSRVESGNIIKTERDFVSVDLYPEINDAEQRQQRINSELSEFNRRGKTTNSRTMHKEFTDNPGSWFRYHALRAERMESWDEIPYEYIATKIKNKNQVVADFGCGENKFRHCIPNNKVYAFDHVAIDETVTACDIRQTNLEDESIDIAVFSLALWGTNYKEYITESYRVLNYGGVIHIAEPAKNYNTVEGEQELIDLITNTGFKVVGGIERRSKFIYITGIKI